MDLLQFPITLVVKAPNQKIADTTVECDQGWTVQKLKEFLSDVYPSKPEKDQQRIIYSGKLLQDHVVLKDVLHKFDPEQTTHTVHLVCSSSTEGHDPSPSSSTEGLRHRNVTSSPSSTSPVSSSNSEQMSATVSAPSPSVADPAPHVAHSTQAQQQYYGGMDANQQMHYANMMQQQNMMTQQMMLPGMYTPEQMMWMQQMYAQQMVQYMQYMQGAVPATVGAGVTPPVAGDAAVNPQPADNAVNQRPANNRPDIIRMNAQGGAVVDDDEEEGNRDWLDWVYTLSRFCVLISILYFYSTIHRFVLVFGFFFLIYAFQAGWLNLRRRQRRNGGEDAPAVAAPAPPQPQPAQQDIPDNAAPADQENAEPEGSSGTEESGESGTEDATPAPPPPPSTFRVIWSFLSTFVTSLVPQQPVAVNAN